MKNLLLIIVISILLVCSCKTTEVIEVPVEKVRTEYINNTRTDSILVRDSIDRWLKGDTLYIYKEHTKFKYFNKTDTVCKTDTITKIVKVDVVKEVEVNHIYWYQKALMWAGGIAVLLLAGGIIYKIKFWWI